MNRLFVSIIAAAALSLSARGQEASLTMRTVEPSKDDNFIPARVPGFELRELNKRRTITYAIDSETEVRLSFPVLIYFPINDGSPRTEVPELRRIYNDLATVAARTQDQELLNALLKIDRLLADMGEKRDTPAAYQTPAQPSATPGPRVISEKRIPTDIPTPTPAPRQVVPQEIDQLPLTPQVVSAPVAVKEPVATQPAIVHVPTPVPTQMLPASANTSESPVMPKMASTK